MSLETVVEDIRDEAHARADEIVAEAEAEADEIVAEAETEAEQLREQREHEVEAQIEQERERTLSAAKLEAKQGRLEARRDALADVREAVEERVAGLEGERREALTVALLEAALEEFDDDEAVEVYGRSDDQALLESVLESYDRASLGGEQECLGGVVVEGSGSRLRVNNTFDSVLEGVWQDDLKEISARLFDE
jgi:V/A-type H+-transporting ATPase subunit E